MSVTGMVVMAVFSVIGLVALNWGTYDKKAKEREAYWDKFEGK